MKTRSAKLIKLIRPLSLLVLLVLAVCAVWIGRCSSCGLEQVTLIPESPVL